MMLAVFCVLPLLVPGLKIVNSASPENRPSMGAAAFTLRGGAPRHPSGHSPTSPSKGEFAFWSSAVLPSGLSGSPDNPARKASDLWGETGENWNPRNRLPDFSYAGYHMGERPIPTVPVWKDLKKDYGARGDGVADDSTELLHAIEDFPGTSPGALYLPQGTYRISERIVVRKPYLVLRGDGPAKSRIAFTRGIWGLYEQYGTPRLEYDYPFMLEFEGVSLQKSLIREGRAPLLAKVSSNAKRGDTKIRLDNASRVSVGNFYVMVVYNDKHGQNDDPRRDDNHFARYLLGNQPPPQRRNFWLDAGLEQWCFKVLSKSGNTIELHKAVPWDLRPHQWLTEIRSFDPKLTENGVEDLTIDFPPTTHPWSHHNQRTLATRWDRGITYNDWSDGYNAISLTGWNSWIRNVKITDADVALKVGGCHNTVVDAEIGNEDRQEQGHYGVRPHFYAHEIVFHNLNFFNTGYVHDLSVQNEHHIVYSKINHAGALSLDTHGGYGNSNLFTEIRTKSGSNLPGTGNARAVAQAMLTTYWNITVSDNNWANGKFFNTERWGANLIGVDGAQWSTDTSDPAFISAKVWVEKWPGSLTVPANLYLAQILKRLGGSELR